MAKLTTDKALSILIDSEQAKKVLKPSYIRQVKHRLKTGKNLELSKKIEILEKLGAVANELTWNVKTNGKTDLKTNVEIHNLTGTINRTQHSQCFGGGEMATMADFQIAIKRQASRQVLSENEIEIARRQSLQAKSRQVQPNLSISSDPTDLI